ncbi:MAG: DegT/DnrJ/EryC1/StrS family aminotransferase [Desulfomicrobium sp.]|nr:DegT/DnrJ/EryC1/StrS family aminotransferase [Pseudomonadota bacterium]MBV1713004.1 DegT/DnrJ/EryC1/StrS family aminotransferase [Desulfomicrobium sp.]MBU4571974.1 DegT/DnrJ/EryC1/StrS family aminotransferase [Pseudomonadota bacterium]MBU4596123.1 DegT/DnrJ/EryC1/StrS family aminotransferase [Pseudomonadota bacterium]MBV1721427.1 DegT/DnrJ/EryC1/StrS family aminotransferase [Desulfomicrobium sp.]
MLNSRIAPWPAFAEDERAAVARVLESGKVNYWTGDECRLFETEYAAYVGRRHGIALANGTLALELALHAFGVGSGDEVVTTCWSFIASASCAVARGAVPVLADVDPFSRNITAETIARVLTPRTKAIICVHLVGWPCDMDPIMELARKHDLVVIEDCAQAHGARYKGMPVGSFGHAAAFSFCQDKIITTGGEGGMLLLDDEHAWKRAWAYKDHGKSWDAVYSREEPAGFRWLHESFGSNWRMTEMQAAIGRIQLGKLDTWVCFRRKNAEYLARRLSSLPWVKVSEPGKDFFHSYYKFYLTLDAAGFREGWDRDRIVAKINAQGMPCLAGICPEIYREQAFVQIGLGPAASLPVANDLGQRSILLLVHPTISSEDIEGYAEVVGGVLKKAMRSATSGSIQ